MTFKEKWELDHPGEKFSLTGHGTESWRCPYKYGYEKVDADSAHCEMGCTACWNREMPSLKAATMAFGNHEVEAPYSGRKPIEYVDTAEFANAEPHILDSGERRQFETGAVRDIQEGKGRCDLMPLEVVAKILNGDSIYNPDLVVGKIALFKNSDYQDTAHLYGALFHFAELWPKRELDMTSTFADIFLEVAKHFEEGAKKYCENNWQKGLPVRCYIDSAVRHYLKWLRGDKDEPHDRAFVWNLMCCIWEVDFSPRAKGQAEVPFMEKHIVHGYIPVFESDSLPNLRTVGEKVSLEDCPIGPFDFNGVLGLKTEYANEVYTIVGGEHMSVNDSDTVQPLEVI